MGSFRENNRHPPWALSLLLVIRTTVSELRVVRAGVPHACLQQFSLTVFVTQRILRFFISLERLGSLRNSRNSPRMRHRTAYGQRSHMFETPSKGLGRQHFAKVSVALRSARQQKFELSICFDPYSSHCIDDRENHASNRPSSLMGHNFCSGRFQIA